MVLTKARFADFIPNADANRLGDTTYALRLGCEYLDINGDYKKVLPGDDIIVPKHDVLVVTSHEKLRMPNDVCGHFGLKVKFAMKGLVYQAGPQIKPGYNGILWGLLINLSNTDIHLRAQEDNYLDIEFSEVQTTKSKSDSEEEPIDSLLEAINRNKVREKTTTSGLANAIKLIGNSATKEDLKESVEQTKKENDTFKDSFMKMIPWYIAGGTVLISIVITLIVGLYNIVPSTRLQNFLYQPGFWDQSKPLHSGQPINVENSQTGRITLVVKSQFGSAVRIPLSLPDTTNSASLSEILKSLKNEHTKITLEVDAVDNSLKAVSPKGAK